MSRLLIPLLLCASLRGTATPQAADARVFYNAGIFTAEPERPYAEAVAIRGDKTVAVGSRSEVAQAVGSGAEPRTSRE